MIVYEVVKITGYDGWGTPSYGEVIERFDSQEKALDYLNKYYPNQGSWPEITYRKVGYNIK